MTMVRYLSLLAGAVALGAVAASSASASTITIDFEGVPPAEFAALPLTIAGVTFTPVTGHYDIPAPGFILECSSPTPTQCLQTDASTLTGPEQEASTIVITRAGGP